MKVRDCVRELLMLDQDAIVVTQGLYRDYEAADYPAPRTAIADADGELYEDEEGRQLEADETYANVVVIG